MEHIITAYMNNCSSITLLLLALMAMFLVLLALLFLLFNYAAPLFTRGIFYVPTEKSKRKKMVELAAVRKGEKAVDLGSGDGCLVMALARAGAEAHGYEINPLLVLWSKMRIKIAGLDGKIFIHWKNFWKKDFAGFDVVTIYGFSHMMAKLEEKLERELKPGARVISNSFPLPTWKPARKENGVYLYKKV